MLGRFRRKSQTTDTPETVALSEQSLEERALLNRIRATQRELQLRLHKSSLFPSEISVDADGWAEVVFSPAHPRNLNAPNVLRKLERAGMLTVDGSGIANADATWTVRMMLGTDEYTSVPA